MKIYDTVQLPMTTIKEACVYLYVSYCGKINQIRDSDIFKLKLRIPDKNNFLQLCLRREGFVWMMMLPKIFNLDIPTTLAT